MNDKTSYITAYMGDSSSVTFPFSDKDLRKFDFCFKTHRISNAWYPNNFYPWAIGLSERILQQLANVPPFFERKEQVLCNFRPTLFGHHSVRQHIYDKFLPAIQSLFTIDHTIDSNDKVSWVSANAYDRLMNGQTGGRHVPAYYNRLLHSQAILTFCGYFLPPFPKKRSSLGGRATRKIVEKLHLKTRYIDQWDSWRFYEALAAGCVPIHVDFEKYGFIMPVMPKNWEHYIGIDLDDLDGSIAKINDNLDRLPEISKAGREWVLENYTPIPTALRFLETVFGKN